LNGDSIKAVQFSAARIGTLCEAFARRFRAWKRGYTASRWASGWACRGIC